MDSVILGSALCYIGYKIAVARRTRASKGSPGVPPPAPLTSEQIKIIKATVPVLQEHGVTITTTFYKSMLTAHPELNDVFNTANQVNGHQPRSLASALFAYASNIDNLAALGPAVELMCNKHASLYIRPEDYKIVGEHLLKAMKEVLGDALTPEIHDAWAAAYWILANIMIDREAALYQTSQGWTDWRDFQIAQKVRESDEITSFYLKPVDGQRLPAFRPGQYISVRVQVPELQHLQPRQYSLSDMPRPDYYRISVKKESGSGARSAGSKAHAGYVSNILHDVMKEGDVVQVSHPFGDFFLSSAEDSSPIVLLSAGVGITPLTSMLNTLTSDSSASIKVKKDRSQRKIHFIHGAHASGDRAFKQHVQSLQRKFPNLRVTFFTSCPAEHDRQGIDYHHAGRIDLQKLDPVEDLYLDDSRTEFYICGPQEFMMDMRRALKGREVGPDRIKMELFGTGGVVQM